MADYVVIVDFRLKPDTQAAFRRLVDANAIASVRSEPGCRRFDVLEPKGENGRIVLYEIYRDRAAFEDHLKTEHFAAFDAAAAGLVTERTVSDFDLVCEASGPLASRGGSGAAVAE
jgi:quinol monooxygenase YgiN